MDADIIDKLIEKEDAHPSKLSKDETEKLKGLFEGNVEKEKFTVQVESLSESDLPVMITQNEFMRRYQDMSKISGQPSFGNFEHYNLVVNGNHPLASRILGEADEEKKVALTKQLIDLAMLSQNILTGEKLSDFVKRSVELL